MIVKSGQKNMIWRVDLIKEWGGDQYDNLADYKYVDIQYDTYQWIRKREGGREIKTKVGTKICRFAQFPEDRKGNYACDSCRRSIKCAEKQHDLLLNIKQ